MSDFLFQVGGPLLADSPVYILRKADEKAAAHLHRMEYITIVESRQQGKTSLINWLIGQFSSQGYTFAVRDLTAAKASVASPTDWYASLGRWLLRQLRFIPRDQRPKPPTDSASWEDFLADMAESAQATDQKVVIVLDEIGAMPSDWATDFFSVIRSVYTSRQSFPFWQHLTFIIAGAFNPKELIQDDTVSNFNVDQRIPLDDFNLSQVKQLVAHLDLPSHLTEATAERVHYWTDGQPYLSQWMCLYLTERKELITTSNIDDIVDDAVERFFQDDTHHLLRIKDLIAEPDLLAYTRRITSEPRPRFSAGLNDKHFRLAHIVGVLKAGPNGLCQIRNRIYERALQSDTITPGESSPITLSSPSMSKEPVRERRKLSHPIADNCADATISFDFLLEQTEGPQDWAGIRLRGKGTRREGYFVIVRRDGRVEIILVGPRSRQRILGSYMLPHTSQTMHFAITAVDTRISVELNGTEIMWSEADQYIDMGDVFLEVCRATATFSNLRIEPIHSKCVSRQNLDDEFRYDAFISYSHKDSAWVRDTLLPHLEREGLCVCIDFRDFEPGAPSLVNMENAVERSHKTLIVLTPEWVASQWTTFESLLIQTDDPAGRKARMIPLRLKPCEPPKRIAMLTYADFTQPSEVEFQLQRLVTAIRQPLSE